MNLTPFHLTPSHPGPRKLLLFCALSLVLFACATAPREPLPYKLYPGPLRPAAELAIVKFGDAQFVAFDGRPTSHADWTEVHLLAGAHEIEWQAEFGVSVMVEPGGWARGGRKVDVTLEGGHAYVLRADRTTGYGYRMYFWIEEEASGRVVAGERRP